MLGEEVQKVLDKYDLLTTDVATLDITNLNAIEDFVKTNSPEWIVNTAAYTDVDGCESNEGFKIAMKVNGDGPGYLAEVAKKNNINFIHISSDYVFGDEKEEGYEEDYKNFDPLNKYGQSKLKGEKEIKKVFGPTDEAANFKTQDPKAYIIRTSWLFGKGANNFLPTILKIATERDEISVVTDEISSPTYIKDLAENIKYIIEEKPEGGIYHISGRGKASRYEFAQQIVQSANIEVKVNKTTSESFSRKTPIAKVSYLKNTKLPQIRKWEDMVDDFITNELNY
jgi:dTDP-4-dehydrorhamnose reductase